MRLNSPTNVGSPFGGISSGDLGMQVGNLTGVGGGISLSRVGSGSEGTDET
jgi:hypothetical protein